MYSKVTDCSMGAVFTFPINLLNLFTCLSVALVYLGSLTLLIKLVHLSTVGDVTKDANLGLHLSGLSIFPREFY